MDQVTPHEKFERLLAHLKKPVALTKPMSTLEAAVMGYRIKDEFLEDHIPTIIKIMESGIFYQGGLKSGYWANESTSIPIRDLETFVFSLAFLFDEFKRLHSLPEQQSVMDREFETIDAILKCLIPIVSTFYGKRNSNLLTQIQKKLENARNKISKETATVPKRFSSKTKQAIAKIFIEHINAPDDTIAERAAGLLTCLGIGTGKELMRKKLHKIQNKKLVRR